MGGICCVHAGQEECEAGDGFLKAVQMRPARGDVSG